MKKKFQDWLRKQVGCPKCATVTHYTGTRPNCQVTYYPRWNQVAYYPRKTD